MPKLLAYKNANINLVANRMITVLLIVPCPGHTGPIFDHLKDTFKRFTI